MINVKKPKPVGNTTIVEIPTGFLFLYIEKKMHHISVFYNIFLSL